MFWIVYKACFAKLTLEKCYWKMTRNRFCLYPVVMTLIESHQDVSAFINLLVSESNEWVLMRTYGLQQYFCFYLIDITAYTGASCELVIRGGTNFLLLTRNFSLTYNSTFSYKPVDLYCISFIFWCHLLSQITILSFFVYFSYFQCKHFLSIIRRMP